MKKFLKGGFWAMELLFIYAVVFGTFILVFILSGRSGSRLEELDEKIKNLQEKILVVTSSDIPTKDVKEVLGSVTGISKSASTEAGFTRAEREAMAAVMRRGLVIGANAIVDLRMTTGSYEQQGTKWMVTRVVYNGTAVRV